MGKPCLSAVRGSGCWRRQRHLQPRRTCKNQAHQLHLCRYRVLLHLSGRQAVIELIHTTRPKLTLRQILEIGCFTMISCPSWKLTFDGRNNGSALYASIRMTKKRQQPKDSSSSFSFARSAVGRRPAFRLFSVSPKARRRRPSPHLPDRDQSNNYQSVSPTSRQWPAR